MVPLNPRKTGRRVADVIAATILSVFLLPGGSWGWGRTWLGINLEQIFKSARGKFGALRYNAAFRLTNAGYDSDLYFGYTPNPVPDYFFTAAPEVSLFVPLAKGVMISVFEIPQYTFFLQSRNERAWGNIFRSQFHFVLDRLYFQAGGGLIDARERLSTELNINIARKENLLEGQAFWQISEGSAVVLQFRSITYEYKNPQDGSFDIRKNLNRTDRFLNLKTYLMQVSRMRVFLDAEYGSFISREPQSNFKDARSYGLFGGVEFSPSPAGAGQERTLQGRVNLGYKLFEIPGSQKKVYQGLVGNTSVAAAISRKTSLHGVYSRNIQFSVYSDLGYYIQTVYLAGISQVLSNKMSINYGLSFSRNDYVRLESAEPGGVRQDQYIIHRLGLSRGLAKNLELNVIATLGLRRAFYSGQVYRHFMIGFALTYGLPGGMPTMESQSFR
jgi:hypothetical protein